MFVVSLQYRAALHRINEALTEHGLWLDRNYAEGVFVLSGRQVPRVGGIILAVNTPRADLERRLREDPFNRLAYASYAITECVPSRVAEGLGVLQGRAGSASAGDGP